MRPSLHLRFVDKSVAAITAAVEIYNKPSFLYREETFAILALNAWELLLKAKVLKDANNSLSSLRVYEPRTTKAGEPSKKLYLRLNRAGNPQSISLHTCIARLDTSATKIPQEIKANLEALTAIRDNSIHFVTASATLARQAQELAAASVRNFVLLSKSWFDRDFSNVLNLVLPLSFISPPSEANAVVIAADESRLVEHLRNLAQEVENTDGSYAVAIRLQLKLERSSLTSASIVQVTKGSEDAIKVQLSEQDIRERYPWDYNELCKRLTARYSDFKQNQYFHDLRLPLLSDDKFCKARYLDPGNPRSAKKDFYNSNVLQVFDKHYKRR
jgi:hypothetical protein